MTRRRTITDKVGARSPRSSRRPWPQIEQSEGGSMQQHTIVAPDEWLAARRELLAQEKEFTRLRDQLSERRRALPWERVTKRYVFDGPGGARSPSELFDGRSQLVVYHFMFHPSWNEGCPSCSFWADNFNGIDVHLAHRDVAFVTISNARFE